LKTEVKLNIKFKFSLKAKHFGGYLACKKLWWDAGVVICLGEVQICIWLSWCHCRSLSLATVNPDSFTFLVSAHLSNSGQNLESLKMVAVQSCSYS